jgi:predicted ATPase
VVAELIAGCESLTVLVTSRERLQLRAEQVYPVPALGDGDANDLFVARARQLDPAFTVSAAVPELCRLLDALPLALELAAARTALFTPEQLLARIGGRLDLLHGPRDADPRQQTLRATIDWSHELLDEAERRLFRRLSVFPAGCTYEEAEEVAGADPDTLQSLLDKSLLRRRDDESEPRYWQLETIREYGEEQLEQMGEQEQTWSRLVDAYVKFARAAEPGWYRGGADQWADRFVTELPNIRAALQWSLVNRPVDALAITAYLGYCWQLAGLLPEMLDWIERAQSRADALDPDLAAYTMMMIGVARHETGRPGAEQLLRASLPLLLERGWLHYHAFILTHIAPYEAARDPVAAEEMLHLAEREALELESDNAAVLGAALSGLAALAEVRGDDEEALTLLERVGELPFAHPAHQIVHLLDVAELLLGAPDLDRAEPWLREADALAEANPPLVTRERPSIDISSAAAALLRGDTDEAERRINRARDAGETTGRTPIIGQALLLQAGLHALRNETAAAVEARRRAVELLPHWTPSGSVRSVIRLLLDPLDGIAPSGAREGLPRGPRTPEDELP